MNDSQENTAEPKNEKVFKSVGRKVKSTAPKVSVIIPAYNIAAYIGEALDSVLNQTFKDFEIILINDGSPDTTEFERVLEPYRDEIVYLRQPNKGVGPARNTGIEIARGELIGFLDGDDVWLPDFLASQIDYLEKNNYDLVYADALLFGEAAFDGKTFMQDAPSEGEANFESLLDLRCNIPLSGSLARATAILEVGMFEPKDTRAQDFNLWLRMTHRGARVGYQKKILLKYRVRLDSISGNNVQRVEREIEAFERIAKILELDKRQQEIVRRQLERLKSNLQLERGKLFLLNEDFGAAKNAFEKANAYRQSKYLKTVIWFVKIAPQLLLKIYRLRRRDEIAFVQTSRP
jgi:glycosyltransferase involved in cell wall biosynthesis